MEVSLEGGVESVGSLLPVRFTSRLAFSGRSNFSRLLRSSYITIQSSRTKLIGRLDSIFLAFHDAVGD